MGEDGVGINTLADLHGYIQYAGGAATVDLEYCGAVIREDNEPKPSAYSFSLAYQLSEPLEIALRYDGFDDDDSSTLQSTSRIGAGFNYTLFEAATLSIEYGRTEEKNDDYQNEYLAKLAIEF
jgi:hypothetical protein